MMSSIQKDSWSVHVCLARAERNVHFPSPADQENNQTMNLQEKQHLR